MRIADHVDVFQLHDGAILLNRATGVYFQINPTALRILRELGANRSLDEVTGTLASETGTDAEIVRADVVTLSEQLLSQRILVEIGR